jgi:hypothetical protein
MKRRGKKVPPWEDHLDNNDNESNEWMNQICHIFKLGKYDIWNLLIGGFITCDHGINTHFNQYITWMIWRCVMDS